MKFTQNYWGQFNIINKIKILTKQVTDTIHASIPTKYQKYPTTTIIKHSNVFAKSNELPYGRLPNKIPHDAYSITIHVRILNPADISHKQQR